MFDWMKEMKIGENVNAVTWYGFAMERTIFKRHSDFAMHFRIECKNREENCILMHQNCSNIYMNSFIFILEKERMRKSFVNAAESSGAKPRTFYLHFTCIFTRNDQQPAAAHRIVLCTKLTLITDWSRFTYGNSSQHFAKQSISEFRSSFVNGEGKKTWNNLILMNKI